MAQQETYGTGWAPSAWCGSRGIYSVAGKMSPVGDFRPASPDSFEDDYDDVSMAGSDRAPPAKGVYLLAGPPGSSPAPQDPNDSEPKCGDLAPKSPPSDPKLRASDPKFGAPEPNSAGFAPKCGGGGGGGGAGPALLLLLLALGALGAAGLGALGLRWHQELRAELELLRSNLSGIWDSVQQDQTRLQFGIRQHQEELQELTTLLCRTMGSSRRCQAGWKSHGSSCFSFSQELLSWDSARNACADLGAHLAVVSTDAEQVFLVESREGNSSYWLGMTAHEGRLAWVNGEDSKIGFWDVWRKDQNKGHKKCVALGPHGRWVQESCSEFRRWICEKPWNC